MGDNLLIGRPTIFQHVFDQINASPRTIKLIAKRHIGWASRGAEAAMDTITQDLFGFGDVGVCKLFSGEVRLHLLATRHPAWIEDI